MNLFITERQSDSLVPWSFAGAVSPRVCSREAARPEAVLTGVQDCWGLQELYAQG